MKYLESYKTFELKDETYLSAASKLSKNHPERAKKLRSFVDDRQSLDIDYLDPRSMNGVFIWDGVTPKVSQNKYYITDVSVRPNILRNNYTLIKGNGNDIEVLLESVNDRCTVVINNFYTDSEYVGLPYSIANYGTPWGSPGYHDKYQEIITHFPSNFYFTDRKSARIFMEIVERESKEELVFSINDIYKS